MSVCTFFCEAAVRDVAPATNSVSCVRLRTSRVIPLNAFCEIFSERKFFMLVMLLGTLRRRLADISNCTTDCMFIKFGGSSRSALFLRLSVDSFHSLSISVGTATKRLPSRMSVSSFGKAKTDVPIVANLLLAKCNAVRFLNVPIRLSRAAVVIFVALLLKSSEHTRLGARRPHTCHVL